MAADTTREAPLGHAAARAVDPGIVVTMLYGFPASYAAIRDYGEIAPGIARAATSDPLFPSRLEGAEATACLLVAWAWEATRFMKASAPSPSLGIYALRPPPGARGSVAMIAYEASLAAIDRMRESMMFSRGRAWHERLAPFVAECRGERGPTSAVLEESLRVATLAAGLLDRYFSSTERPMRLLLAQDSATSAR